MAQCWASVYDAGPTLSQHWLNVLCLLGISNGNFCLRTAKTADGRHPNNSVTASTQPLLRNTDKHRATQCAQVELYNITVFTICTTIFNRSSEFLTIFDAVQDTNDPLNIYVLTPLLVWRHGLSWSISFETAMKVTWHWVLRPSEFDLFSNICMNSKSKHCQYFVNACQ